MSGSGRASRILDVGVARLPMVAAVSFGVALLYAVIVVGYLLTVSPETLVAFVPDDTFYYLTVARHRVLHGIWSFDGLAPATGFHPLHGQVLALAVAMGLGEEGLVRFAVGGMAVLALGVASLVGASAYRRGDVMALLLLALFVTSRNVLINLGSGMEWAWVIAISVALVAVVRSAEGRGVRWVVLAFALGWAGNWARFDFGLWPAALTGAAVFAWLRNREEAQAAMGIAAAASLIGAVLGVLSNFLKNYMISGQILPGSAVVKSHWMTFVGPSSEPILDKIVALFGSVDIVTELGVLALVVLSIRAGARRLRREGSGGLDAVIWLGSAAAVLGYLIFYSFNPAALQHWYTAHLIVPLFLLLTLPFRGPISRDGRFFAAVLVALLCLQLLTMLNFLSNPQWPHQRYMLKAGRVLAERGIDDAASWNAGIIGYYQGGGVTNLDGLVNDDVLSAILEGTLPEYIDRRGIGHIVDFARMIEEARYPRRGGYENEAFLSRLEVVERFDPVSDGWSGLTLYRVGGPRISPEEE